MIDRKLKIIKEHIDILQSEQNLFDENKTKYILSQNSNFSLQRSFQEEDRIGSKLFYSNINGKKFYLKNIDEMIIIDSLFDSTDYIKTSYQINEFESKNFRKNKYFQMIIHSSKKTMLNIIFEELINVSTERKKYFQNGISFQVSEIRFNLYFVQNYFIIENLDALEFEKFKDCSHIASMCFGFITSYVPRKEAYYFSYTNNDFQKNMGYAYSSNLIESYDNSFYQPIDTILYYHDIVGLSKEEREKKEKILKNNLFHLSNKSFSKLCTLCLNKKQIAQSVGLIMEANQISLDSQAIVYSVALETLTNYISTENENKLKPISNKQNAKNLIKDLHVLAKKYFDENQYKDSAISKRINNINSPTNMDKLIKPFELLKIPIIEEDKKIINHRNNFLHGNDFIKKDEFKDIVKEHVPINHRLTFLVYALILKLSGHHGKIVNFEKIPLSSEKLIDNNCYREIGIIYDDK